MNAISISIVAIILTAALAAIAPVTHYAEHEYAVLSAHAASARAQVQPGDGTGGGLSECGTAVARIIGAVRGLSCSH